MCVPTENRHKKRRKDRSGRLDVFCSSSSLVGTVIEIPVGSSSSGERGVEDLRKGNGSKVVCVYFFCWHSGPAACLIRYFDFSTALSNNNNNNSIEYNICLLIGLMAVRRSSIRSWQATIWNVSFTWVQWLFCLTRQTADASFFYLFFQFRKVVLFPNKL